MADRAVEMMCRRAAARIVGTGPLADKQMVQDMIAMSRIEVEAARLAMLTASWRMDTPGRDVALRSHPAAVRRRRRGPQGEDLRARDAAVDVSEGAAVERAEDRLRESLERFIARRSGAPAAVVG